jgi:hypothetical protein
MDTLSAIGFNKDIEWNIEIEELLKEKQFECVKLAWVHNKDSEKYYHYHNYIFIFNAFITSLSSCSIIMSNSVFGNVAAETTAIINISFGAVLIFSTALNSFQHMTNYSEQSGKHKDACAKYTSLSNNMLKLLALDKATKETSMEFFTWADTEFTNLQINSPNPSDYAVHCYKKDNPQIREIFTVKIESDNGDDKETMRDFAIRRWTGNMY